MKKKTKLKKHRKKEKNGLLKFIFLSGFLLLLFGALWYESQDKNILTIASEIASNTPRGNLQMETFRLPTSSVVSTPTSTPTLGLNPPTATPTKRPQAPGGACSHETGENIDPNTCVCSAMVIRCENNKCAEINFEQSDPIMREQLRGLTCQQIDQMGMCVVGALPWGTKGDGWLCNGKPVIYLYPEVPTYVDVSVTTPGKIVVSDPLYPTGGPASPGKPASSGGWKQVLAYPDGSLLYEGGTYKELFYESMLKDVEEPAHGLTLDATKLRPQLDEIITKLGLIGSEKTEFLDFWVPKLQALNTPHVFFSVLSSAEKDRIDKVTISPKPDTMIEFLAYFKPLQLPFTGAQLVLPNNPQKRIGFTAVEWGGMINDEKNGSELSF